MFKGMSGLANLLGLGVPLGLVHLCAHCKRYLGKSSHPLLGFLSRRIHGGIGIDIGRHRVDSSHSVDITTGKLLQKGWVSKHSSGIKLVNNMFPMSITDCIGGYDLNCSMEDGFKELSHGKGTDMVERVI